MAENLRVAVRVRPFNQREKDRNAGLVVQMEGNSTLLKDPKNSGEKPRKFNFDFSYWSHDGYKERADGYLEKDKSSSKYCDQERVFDDLGKGILQNAWNGYNSTLFAYGQTGSGKSYSIVGYGVNRGVVPVLADRLFAEIGQKSGNEEQFEVSFSMLEIYSEQVRDLLNPATIKSKGGLKVRENPQRGFYVESLQTVAVATYADIADRMSEGTKNRTVAATNMNATSSRAHTIVGITFVQKFKNEAGEEMAKTSVTNLVDLAGSERADSTGATGDRLKEGAAINLSLSSLGNVISALVDRQAGKKVRVPYRDSVLTKLLKNALGGNSKTVMIAAISPADINYDETLSTLRYADRAKQIKTVAKVNEDPTAKLIRELQEENERLKALIGKGGAAAVAATVNADDEELTDAEKEEMKREYEELMAAAVQENERRMKDMEQSWQEKLELAQREHGSAARKELEAKMQTTPHLYNLNADPQMSKVIVHILEKGQEYTIGKPTESTNIPLSGASIMTEHALIRYGKGNDIFLKIVDPEAKVRFNGELLITGDEMQLRHNDRVLFGTSHLYVFSDPAVYKAAPQNYPEVSYEMAQDEISASIGLSSAAEKSKAEAAIREELASIRPLVDEANSISEELDQKIKFDVLVVPPHHRGVDIGNTEIMVRIRNLENGMAWVWSKEKFINRKYIMQEMYEDSEQGETISPENNPFVEDAITDVLIASAVVSPQCLAYMIDLTQQFPLNGFSGENVGVLNASLIPCDSKGREIIDDKSFEFIDDPKELIGRKYKVKVKIDSVRGLPKRFKDIFVKYDMYLETDVKTKVVSGTSNPDFKFSQTHQFNPVTAELITWMRNGNLIFQVWGKQQSEATGRRKLTTRQMTKTDSLAQAASEAQQTQSKWKMISVDKMAKGVLERRCDALQRKLQQLHSLINAAEQQRVGSIRVDTMKKVLAAQDSTLVDQLIMKLAKVAEQDAARGESQGSKACNMM